MALIGTLRTKMGTWVVVFVFVAIAAFILGDLFGNNGVLLGRNTVGEIAGTEITLEEYQAAIQEREANYILNFGRNPGEREMTTVRQQAWDLLIVRHAIEDQYKKVGVTVSNAEVEDLIWGKNVDENVKQAFTNPQTGQFDKSKVISYLGQLKTMPPTSEQRVRWEMFQRDLAPGRTRLKYENLLIKTDYITTAETEREYHNQSDVADASYLFVPFYAVSDSAVKVTDSDLKEYYNKNLEKYKTESTRDIKYVTFPVQASKEDTVAIFEEVIKLAGELKISTEDSAFVVRNSDNSNAFNKYTLGNLPATLASKTLTVGEVYGPAVENGAITVYKVSRVENDTIASARASHILIKWDNESEPAKKAAKEKARGILKEIKGGASFAMKALEHGTDGTRDKGGDLGWFSTGAMVKPFEKAVFDATKTGLLNDVVETQFGYHIINVTNTKTSKSYYVATIERQITPSDASINEALRKAEAFANSVSDIATFEEKAKAAQLEIKEDGKRIYAGDRNIGGLGEARQVVQWLFRDASKGKVSTVFDLQSNYVVAVMTNEISKGYKPMSVVEEEMKPAVKNQLKGKIIISKLEAAKGTLDEIKASFGNDANVYSSSDLRLNTNALPNVGFDPQAVGMVYALENGKRSKPTIGETGVYIIELKNKTIAPAIADYSPYKLSLQQASQNRSYSIAEAIKENAGIEDERYKFF